MTTALKFDGVLPSGATSTSVLFQSINYCFMPLSILQKDQKQGKWIKKAHTKQEENSLCP